MFDKARYDAMPKFEEFTYWFIRTSEDVVIYAPKEVFLTSGERFTSQISEDYTDTLPDDVKSDYIKFCDRPEYFIGNKVNIDTTGAPYNDQEAMIDCFENLIAGSIFIRQLNSMKNPDTAVNAIAQFLNWIRSTDFYVCPASTRFHDADPNGLLFHTLNVYNNMVELKKINKFENVPYDSIVLVSLCHDLTKIGNYELYMKNVKDEATKQWNEVPCYRWKCNPFPFGHGVASMYLVSQFFRLSVDEMLAIRWHMGEYRVATHETGELEDACERYPLVRMVQFADQLACVKY